MKQGLRWQACKRPCGVQWAASEAQPSGTWVLRPAWYGGRLRSAACCGGHVGDRRGDVEEGVGEAQGGRGGHIHSTRSERICAPGRSLVAGSRSLQQLCHSQPAVVPISVARQPSHSFAHHGMNSGCAQTVSKWQRFCSGAVVADQWLLAEH